VLGAVGLRESGRANLGENESASKNNPNRKNRSIIYIINNHSITYDDFGML
jgi:hypothetical protein